MGWIKKLILHCCVLPCEENSTETEDIIYIYICICICMRSHKCETQSSDSALNSIIFHSAYNDYITDSALNSIIFRSAYSGIERSWTLRQLSNLYVTYCFLYFIYDFIYIYIICIILSDHKIIHLMKRINNTLSQRLKRLVAK